ncbi:MAG: HEAT repeat domain-containing protein [Pseudomonadota bacterium]|nr:HEAT repeat domain-containing protein [Pseudomonadota bacterium]
MTRAWLLCVLALLMDAGLVSLTPGLHPSLAQLSAVVMLHGAVCLLFCMALPRLLPQLLRSPALDARVFVFVSIFFIPVMGMAGLLACIVPALNRPGPSAPHGAWRHTSTPGLPGKPAQPQAPGVLPRGCDLAEALQHAADSRQRIAALIATLSLSDQQAVPLLRLALKDPDDEVRLLAYALLNRKEKAVEARMRQQQGAPAGDASGQLFLQHKALAHDYWELAHLGDPHGDALVSLCRRAHEHVQAALKLRAHDGGLHFLSGRILLLQLQLDAASDAFEAAQACGTDARQVAGMLAEVAFRRQRYGDVRHHLNQAGSGARQLQLGKLSTYWAGEHV